MSDLDLDVLDAFEQGPALSGCWKLGPGQALTLRPARPGVLRITHGRVWITFDHACHDGGARGGDHFLEAGTSFRLLPGQALVMESWRTHRHTSACFSWEPLPASDGVAVHMWPVRLFDGGTLWRAGVLQPLRDLGLATGLAGAALARLAAGLAAAPVRACMALGSSLAVDDTAAVKPPAGK